MLLDVGDDGLLPHIAFDGLDSEDELVNEVETAISGRSNG